MIKLKNINQEDQHFVISSDEPCRVEVSAINGKIIAHAYKGSEVDMEQEPDLCFDGTVDNKDCIS